METKEYRDGSPGVCIYYDGSASAFYPEGGIAVNVSVRQNGKNVETVTYCYDEHSKLLACFDAQGLGSAQELAPKSRRLLVKTDGVGLQLRTGAFLKRVDGMCKTTNEWCYPLEMDLHKCIHMTMKSRTEIEIDFLYENVNHKFQVIQASTLGAFMKQNKDKGRAEAAPLPLGFKELPDRTQPLLRGTMRSKHSEISELLSTLGNLTRKMNDFSSTQPLPSRSATPDPLSKTQKMTSTRPRASTSMALRSNQPSWSLKEDTFLQAQGVDWTKSNEKDIKRMVALRNPVLVRSQVIRHGSGKYCIDQPIKMREVVSIKKMRPLTSRNFDEAILDPSNQHKLVVVCCLAIYDKNSHHAQQMIEVVYGNLKKSNDTRFVLYKIDPSESRLLINRYNLRAFPAVLMYFNGRLVRAQHIGGKVYKVRTKPPKMLFVENDPYCQLSMERHLKAYHCDWDLIMDSNDFRRLNNNVRDRYKILLIDLDMDKQHVDFIANSLIPAGQPPKGVKNYGPFIVGYSKHRVRKGEESNGPIKCHLRLNKPVGNKQIEIIVQRAQKYLSPVELSHKGTSHKDFMRMLEASYKVAKEKVFLPEDFRFRIPTTGSRQKISRGR